MQLNHKTFGQGPPLIILHGLFGTLDNWQTLAKRWADHYTVVLVDQRNHGRSPHLDAHSYPLMAEDLKAFMEANWMYEASLLGQLEVAYDMRPPSVPLAVELEPRVLNLLMLRLAADARVV